MKKREEASRARTQEKNRYTGSGGKESERGGEYRCRISRIKLEASRRQKKEKKEKKKGKRKKERKQDPVLPDSFLPSLMFLNRWTMDHSSALPDSVQWQ